LVPEVLLHITRRLPTTDDFSVLIFDEHGSFVVNFIPTDDKNRGTAPGREPTTLLERSVGTVIAVESNGGFRK
jgi:hypothetical protein